MGTGIDVSRALTRLLAALVLGGCVDFVEPELPERGAPAVLVLNVRLRDMTDVEVEARLVPGLDEGGNRRRLEDERMRVMNRDLSPDSTSGTGTRVYREAWTAGAAATAGPIESRAPRIAGLGTAPAFRWYALERDGPAEVRLGPGDDLPLALTLDPGEAEPEPDIRQWFLTLSDGDRVFRLSSDGLPPATILVPSHWVPAGDSVAVSLVYQQSAKVEIPMGGYIALFGLDARLSWTVRRPPAAGSARG